jgi:hypothetical protein
MLLFSSDGKADLYFADSVNLKPLYPYSTDIVDKIIYDQQPDETLVTQK